MLKWIKRLSPCFSALPVYVLCPTIIFCFLWIVNLTKTNTKPVCLAARLLLLLWFLFQFFMISGILQTTESNSLQAAIPSEISEIR